MHVLSPHLVCAGAAEAIAFYAAAFGATEMIRLAGPDGKLMYARISLNGSSVMLVDENPAFGMLSPKSLNGSPVTIHLIVKDADAVVQRAVEAGATVKMPVQTCSGVIVTVCLKTRSGIAGPWRLQCAR
jgi:PhnB protein